jgi:hypothetical protein
MTDFVCLRGFVTFALERNVSEIFDCEFERETVGGMFGDGGDGERFEGEVNACEK